ncbi:MAG: PP2C family protein-serine/threonine phosphatase, partial [Planctomycetota bacterium]
MGSWNDGLKCTALTDVGMRRRNNQDAHRVVLAPDEATWRERGHVLMVADGIGAHAAGELASKLAVDNVPHLYLKHRELSPPEALRKAIQE